MYQRAPRDRLRDSPDQYPVHLDEPHGAKSLVRQDLFHRFVVIQVDDLHAGVKAIKRRRTHQSGHDRIGRRRFGLGDPPFDLFSANAHRGQDVAAESATRKIGGVDEYCTFIVTRIDNCGKELEARRAGGIVSASE